MQLSAREKTCPRCHKRFLCQPNAIEDCQCAGVQLEERHHEYLASVYTDCLCQACLLQIKQELDAS